jgi:hypothetical protein
MFQKLITPSVLSIHQGRIVQVGAIAETWIENTEKSATSNNTKAYKKRKREIT